MREISSFIGASHRPATPTAFASQISQFPLSRRRRPRSLCESVNSPCLGDADRVRFANRSIPRRRRLAKIPAFVSAGTRPTPAHLFLAGVQTMRARICSALSCAMFARVVWLRLRRAAKPPTFTISFAARTCHARLARLTRARGGCFLRGRKALLNDFWYFSSQKSTIKEKFLYFKDNTSSVSLWLTPSAPVSATPTAFAPQIGQFPTGEGFHPLFLLHIQAQKKKLSKRKCRDGVISHSAECDHRCRWTTPPFKKKAGENFEITT